MTSFQRLPHHQWTDRSALIQLMLQIMLQDNQTPEHLPSRGDVTGKMIGARKARLVTVAHTDQ